MDLVNQILNERFLIQLIWVDQIELQIRSDGGDRGKWLRQHKMTVLASEKYDRQGYPLREATYSLRFDGVSRSRVDLPILSDDQDLDMDVDDITLHDHGQGHYSIKFANAVSTIEIDFESVTRDLIAIKECEA